MSRQLLRSRAGCNRCKLRRKKCDERKPVCASCERLGLICSWGSESQTTTSRDIPNITHTDGVLTPNAAIQLLPLSRHVSTGVPAFQNQTQFDLMIRFPDIFKFSLAPTASAEYRDVSTFMNIAIHDEGVRNAMSAVSGWVSYVQTGEPFFEQTSLENYQRAVISLRQKLLQDTDGNDKIPLLLAAVYLGAVEACGLGNPQLAAYHYGAAARLWSRIRYEDLTDERIKSLHKIVAEIWLVFLANLGMFLTLTELNRVINSIDWSALSIAFQQSTDSTLPACAISPHVALDHGYFRLIIQITHFGRLTYEHPTNYALRQQQLDAWFSEITQLELSLTTAFVGIPKAIAETYRIMSYLYIYTLRIFLNKIAAPGSCSSSAEISSSFNQALALLASLESKSYMTSILGWPLRILLCAACKEEDFQSIVTKCKEAAFDGGTVRVNARVMRVVRKLRKGQPCSGNNTCTRSHDGLQMLTLKDGIISLENASGNQVHVSISLPQQKQFAWLWQRM